MEIPPIHRISLTPPLQAFKRLDDRQIEEIIKHSDRDETEEEDQKSFILCKNCNNVITTAESKITMNGSHTHVFKNPRGIVFEIGCFRKAEGCVDTGTPTQEYTWFPGFTWCFSLCSNCLIHLGWLYQSGSEQFYGLILENLVER